MLTVKQITPHKTAQNNVMYKKLNYLPAQLQTSLCTKPLPRNRYLPSHDLLHTSLCAKQLNTKYNGKTDDCQKQLNHASVCMYIILAL